MNIKIPLLLLPFMKSQWFGEPVPEIGSKTKDICLTISHIITVCIHKRMEEFQQKATGVVKDS